MNTMLHQKRGGIALPESGGQPVAEAPGSPDAASTPAYDLIELLFFAYRDFVGDADRLLESIRFGRAHHRVLHFVQRHPGLTIAELLEYEAMGLTAEGQGARAIKEGWTRKDGKLPVNASGGLKAKGHPIGATGVSMHALTAMQLTGEAGDMQIQGAKLGGIFNMGGAAVANYVSILERLR